jgi:hypothetical protein
MAKLNSNRKALERVPNIAERIRPDNSESIT